MNKLITQFLRYSVVGGLAFIVDYGTLVMLTEVFGLHHLLSAAISFVLGLVCNYLLSTAWVFGESKLENKYAEFISFAVIGIIGLGFNELIIYLGTDICHLHYMLSKIISTVIVFFWNFTARRFLLFKS